MSLVGTENDPWKLRSLPQPGPQGGVAAGEFELSLSEGGRALLSVPKVAPGATVPLMVVLHGAGWEPEQMVALLAGQPGARGVAVLSLKSRGFTWDQIIGEVGPDPILLDEALTETYTRVPVDPSRTALAGFSDGASYALSLGLGNGDVFSHLLSFSPGFCLPGGMVGKPHIFISHGVNDPVLRIELASRRIVPVLIETGYMIEYKEFPGDHEAPGWAIARALDLLIDTPGPKPRKAERDRPFR